MTQATVSRDIRELRLVKTATGSGGYRYVAASIESARSAIRPAGSRPSSRIGAQGGLCRAPCLGQVLFRHGQCACEVFDARAWDNVVGTLSGDDTFLS